jgi:putative sigma-54 modulation protein
MQLLIKGKNLEVTDAVRAHVSKKLNRLDRYLDSISQTEVEISMEKTKAATDRYVVEVTMMANGTILRGEEKAGDIHSAVDTVVDVMQRRLTRFKERLQRRGRGASRGAPIEEPETDVWSEEETPEGEAAARARPQVVRTKTISLKPMSEEEAGEQMDLLGHDFFLFANASTNRIAVIYRRNDGDYGLIESDIGG